MLFPQFSLYENKKTLSYVDLNNLLLLTINLRETWNYCTLKNATHKTWMNFKDKLSNDQKVILRNAIISLRSNFKEKLIERDTIWLSSKIVSSLLSLTSPSLLSFKKRQVILKKQMYSLELT